MALEASLPKIHRRRMGIMTRTAPELLTRCDAAAAFGQRVGMTIHTHALCGIGIHKYLEEIREVRARPEIFQFLAG